MNRIVEVVHVGQQLLDSSNPSQPVGQPPNNRRSSIRQSNEPAAEQPASVIGEHQRGAGFANSLPSDEARAKASSRGISPGVSHPRGPIMAKLLHYDVIERLGEGARSVIYAVS